MKTVVLLVLLAAAFSVTCPALYVDYLTLVAAPGAAEHKCTNPSLDPCVSNPAIELEFESEYLSLITTCPDFVDPYNSLTPLTDWPASQIESLSQIIYEYTGAPMLIPAVTEYIAVGDFGLTPAADVLYPALNENRAVTGDGIDNVSWVYAAKYVADYWISNYETVVGTAWFATMGEKVSAQYIYDCIAVDATERKLGLYTEDLFERINTQGLQSTAGYIPGTCSGTFIPRPFQIKKVLDQNRGGLIRLIDYNYIPIVPISFDLEKLKFMQTMSPSDTPVTFKSAQPSLFGVLNSFDSSAATPYWDVITNILPEMPIRLTINMSPDLTNSNYNGIAAFAVGIKLDLGMNFDNIGETLCDNNGDNLISECLVLNRNVCDDKTTNVLDLSAVVLPTGDDGIYIPVGADCLHIDTVIYPSVGGAPRYCGVGSLSMCGDTQHWMEENVCEHFYWGDPVDCSGRRRLADGDKILGTQPGGAPNTFSISITFAPGAYAMYGEINFKSYHKLESLLFLNKNSAVQSFTHVRTINIEDCPKLSRVSFYGDNSFPLTTDLNIATGTVPTTKPTMAAASNNCPYRTVAGPYINHLTLHSTNNNFPALTNINISGNHCFEQMNFLGDGLGQMVETMNIVGSHGDILKNITFEGNNIFPVGRMLNIQDHTPLQGVSFSGTSMFSAPQVAGKSAGAYYIRKTYNLLSIAMEVDGLFNGWKAALVINGNEALTSFITSGDNTLNSFTSFFFRNTNKPAAEPYPLLTFVITGNNSFRGHSNSAKIDVKEMHRQVSASISGNVVFNLASELLGSPGQYLCPILSPYMVKPLANVNCMDTTSP